MVLRHGRTCSKKCVESYCELANKKKEQVYKVPTPCLDDLQKGRGLESFLKFALKSCANVCSQTVLKCSYLERSGRPDILWSVIKLARAWTRGCGKRLARLISYIHHTHDYRQYCHVGNAVQQCRPSLFQESDFAGDLEDSKSTSGGNLCIFGRRTFVPVSWMCKKQTSVSHSSTESEIISLDAGLRMDAILTLDSMGCGERSVTFVAQQEIINQGRSWKQERIQGSSGKLFDAYLAPS